MKCQSWFCAVFVALIAAGCTQETIAQSSNPEVSAIETIAPSPTPADSAIASTPIKSGQFVSGEHPTQGTVRLVVQDGKRSLEFDQDFMTSELGPDLVVILHRSDNVIGSAQPPAYSINPGDYVLLAPLQQYSGAQSYAIPDSINLEDYRSVAIWCRKFNATFGAAVLN